MTKEIEANVIDKIVRPMRPLFPTRLVRLMPIRLTRPRPTKPPMKLTRPRRTLKR